MAACWVGCEGPDCGHAATLTLAGRRVCSCARCQEWARWWYSTRGGSPEAPKPAEPVPTGDALAWARLQAFAALPVPEGLSVELRMELTTPWLVRLSVHETLMPGAARRAGAGAIAWEALARSRTDPLPGLFSEVLRQLGYEG